MQPHDLWDVYEEHLDDVSSVGLATCTACPTAMRRSIRRSPVRPRGGGKGCNSVWAPRLPPSISEPGQERRFQVESPRCCTELTLARASCRRFDRWFWAGQSRQVHLVAFSPRRRSVRL